MKAIRSQLLTEDALRLVFDKVFNADIERLLAMADMWKHRTPPQPLRYSDVAAHANGLTNGHSANGSGTSLLKDQRALDLGASFKLFDSR